VLRDHDTLLRFVDATKPAIDATMDGQDCGEVVVGEVEVEKNRRSSPPLPTVAPLEARKAQSSNCPKLRGIENCGL
jgi:hypothetical protein